MARITHRGRVLDASGQPLYQAHVITINSNPKRGVVTDQNGWFTVVGNLHESFEISHIGFTGQIFRLDRYMGDKTYSLSENVNELEGVIVSPREQHYPKIPKNSSFNLDNIFQTLGDVFNATVRPAQTKVVTTRAGIATGNQNINANLLRRGINTDNNLSTPTNWVKDNPLAASGIVVAVIALGAMIFKNKEA
ncbi:carboxypeptidase-like regulatory domain-containing protein [Maribacter sp.]|uniref:carboxypeptidase-like regulatory domain-containing protein n=1 Tax=Maribacter sp. TaxID=1897614 RepID=UPI0025B7B977|nr:carboxypeptidase-like regulatory domain-containing protein [Maribacter sp.]